MQRQWQGRVIGLLVVGAAVLGTGYRVAPAAAPAAVNVSDDECGLMPSCAPRPEWECHHLGPPHLWWPDKCDPESPGCLDPD